MLTLTRPNNHFVDDWSKEFDKFFNFKNGLKSDVFEIDDGYEIKVEVPGVDRDDMEIFLNDGLLTLKVNKKKEEKKHCVNEIEYGVFEKSWRIPFKTREDKVQAKCKDGILFLTIPKTPEKKRIIMIE